MPKPKLNVHAVSTQPKGPRKSKRLAKMEGKLPPYLRLMANPFDVPPEGSLRPDHNSTPTVIWKEQGSFNVTPNADGNFWLQFTAAPKGLYYSNAFTAGTTVTTGTSAPVDIPNYVELAAAFSSFRAYALAIELEYIGQSDLCKGVIGTCQTVQFMNVVGTDASALIDEPCYEEGGADQKMATVARFTDNASFGPVSLEYYGAATTPPCVVHVLGQNCPTATGCFRVRWHLIGEYTAGPTKMMSRSIAHSASHPAQISAAANIIGKKAIVAFDPSDPASKLVNHAMKLAEIGGSLNGLWQASKPVVSMLAEFAALM